MKAIVTPWDVVNDTYQAKRFVAMKLDGVGNEKDVRREVAQMSESGTRTVLITDEQYERLDKRFFD